MDWFSFLWGFLAAVVGIPLLAMFVLMSWDDPTWPFWGDTMRKRGAHQ
jgi:hypothetical protein